MSADTTKERNASSDWKELTLEGLRCSGGIRLMGKMARYLELRPGADGRARLKRRTTARFAVLCYHRIGTGGVPLYSQLPSALFASQMRFLRSNYRVISLDQMLDEMASPQRTTPAVAVTFDDGYRGLFTDALPVLKAYNIPATVFLTVEAIEADQIAWYDRIFLALHKAPAESVEFQLDSRREYRLDSDSSRIHAAADIISYLRSCTDSDRRTFCADLEHRSSIPKDELRGHMLTWEQIRLMLRAGIQFGSHTMSHPVVSRLASAELEWELVHSKRVLENKLKSPVRHFAFPFGKFSECGDRAVRALVRSGYRSAATTEWGLNSVGSDPFQLRRVQIGEMGSLARFAFELHRLFLSGDSAHHAITPVSRSSESTDAQQERVGVQ